MSRKKPIEIEVNGNMTVKPGGVYPGKVVKIGNGAMIRSYKKFIGEKVIVIIESKIKKRRLKDGETPPELEEYSGGWK